MKKKYADRLELEIHTNDSAKAKDFRILSSTSVFFENAALPLATATDKALLDAFLSEKL
jgi:hypothetical protein